MGRCASKQIFISNLPIINQNPSSSHTAKSPSHQSSGHIHDEILSVKTSKSLFKPINSQNISFNESENINHYYISQSKEYEAHRQSSMESKSTAATFSLEPFPLSSSSNPLSQFRNTLLESNGSINLSYLIKNPLNFVSKELFVKILNMEKTPILLFGDLSSNKQRGFDNKKEQAYGTENLDSFYNHVGYACKKGLKPEFPNQDDYFILSCENWSLYCVFDGHGPYGHYVSSFVHTILPFLIITDPLFITDPITAMKKSFAITSDMLKILTDSSSIDTSIDCSLSGTTATIVLNRESKLYIAHVGDSRAIIGNTEQNKIIAKDLTNDHKPTTYEEKQRIESSGGEIRRRGGDIPYRVFVKHQFYPGLAMSRALGDTIGSSVGVISDPDINVVDITSETTCLIIATDGVWEFISSQESINLISIKSFKFLQDAAHYIAYESWKRWLQEEVIVDDVTCIIVWFKKFKSNSIK